MDDDSFPLLKFPPQALSIIFQQLTLMDLFELSMCSQNAKTTIMANNSECNRHTVEASIPRRLRVCEYEYWHFYTARDPRRFAIAIDPTNRMETRRVGGLEVDFFANQFLGCHSFITDTRDQYSAAVLQHIADILPTRIQSVEVELEDIDDLNTILATPCIKRAACFALSSGREVSNDELNMILKDLEVETLRLSIKVGPNSVFERKLSVPTLILNMKHLNLGHLLQIDSKQTIIENATFTNWDLNIFVKNWLGNPESKITSMDIFYDASAGRFLNTQQIVDGIDDLYPTNGAVAKIHARGIWLRGLDVRRSDGRLATIMISEHKHQEQLFYFFVQAFPNPYDV